MLRINLLPVKKIKQQAEAWRQLKIFGIVFAVLLALLVIVIVSLISKVNGLNAEITRLEQRKNELAEILKQIEELKQKKKAVDEQTALIEKVEKSSALTAHILDEVAKLTPNERLWLTSLTQNGASGATLTLTGIALDNQTVAEFLEKLKNSPYINDDSVKLANSTEFFQAGRNLKRFSLSCAVAMPEEPGKEKAEGASAEASPAVQKN